MITAKHLQLLQYALNVNEFGLTDRIRYSDNRPIPWTGNNNINNCSWSLNITDPADQASVEAVTQLVVWGLAVEVKRTAHTFGYDTHIYVRYAATDLGGTCLMAHLNLEARNPPATHAEFLRRKKAKRLWQEAAAKLWKPEE